MDMGYDSIVLIWQNYVKKKHVVLHQKLVKVVWCNDDDL